MAAESVRKWDNIGMAEATESSVPSFATKEEERAYWRTRTPLERLAALELLRQKEYGYDPETARVERVLQKLRLEDVYRDEGSN